MPLASEPQYQLSTVPANPTPVWQQVYRQLELNKFTGVTSYQVNNNLFIVVPLDED